MLECDERYPIHNPYLNTNQVAFTVLECDERRIEKLKAETMGVVAEAEEDRRHNW